MTIVDGTGFQSPVFDIGGASPIDTKLVGLTIRNGSGKGIGALRDGGGIHFSGWHLDVQACVLDHNAATRRGGGAFVGAGAIASWTDCVFSENSCIGQQTTAGGGLCMSPFGGNSCSFTRCSFTGNVASTPTNGGTGGGASVQSAMFDDCTFEGNVAGVLLLPGVLYGGGGALQANDTVALTNCLFMANQGGGVTRFGGDDDVVRGPCRLRAGDRGDICQAA